MTQVEIQHGAASDVGLVRESNEDAFLVAPPVFVVADGMGGHDAGEVASAIVVEEFAGLADAGYDPWRGAEAVAATLRRCQDRITAYGAEQRAQGAGGSGRFHAGTTAVVALLVTSDEGPAWLLANLGDSRSYRFTDGVLEQVSVDHSLVQELVDSGTIAAGDAASHPERHVVTRAVGGPRGADADYVLLPVGSVGRLLLCSDGVTEMLDDHRIAELLGAATTPADAADRLVAAAVEAGGRDNATAVVVDVLGLVPDDDTPPQQGGIEEKQGARP